MQETIKIDMVLEMIKRAGYCYGKDSARPGLNGILVTPAHDRISVVATDGHRLAIWNDSANDELESVFMHAAVIEYVQKWHDDIESITIESHDHSQCPIRVKMRTDAVKKPPKEEITPRSVTFDLGEVDFPPYRMIVPNHSSISVFTHTLKFKRDLNVLKKGKNKIAELLTDQGSLYVVGADDGSEKWVTRSEVGKVTPGTLYKNEPFRARYNMVYLYECVKSIPQATLCIKLSGQYDPMVIQSEDSTHVVMPMRI